MAPAEMAASPRLHRTTDVPKAPSLPQQVAEGLFHDLSTDFGNRRGQWNVLRTNLNTILREAAFLDAAIAHQCGQTLALQGLAGRMRVEQAHLRDSGSADKSRVLVELRAGFHATATRNATRQRIGSFLCLHSHARSRTEVVAAIDRHPGFDF